MRRALALAAVLVFLAGCGGGSEAEEGGETTAQTTAAEHTTEVDGATCGELESVVRRNEVAGVLADEYSGTLVARNLLVPTFSGVLAVECDGQAADTTPVPDVVERADVARRKTLYEGGSFVDNLLGEASGEEPSETVAEGTVVQQANAACERYRSLIAKELNRAVGTYLPWSGSSLARRVDDLSAELASAGSRGGPDAALIESFSAGLQELADLALQIEDAERPGSETDPEPLKQALRERAGELERSLPEATLYSCKYMVDIYS